MSRLVWLFLFLLIAVYRLFSWHQSGALYDLMAAAGFVLLAVYSFHRPASFARPAEAGPAHSRAPHRRVAALGVVAFGLILVSFVWRLAAL